MLARSLSKLVRPTLLRGLLPAAIRNLALGNSRSFAPSARPMTSLRYLSSVADVKAAAQAAKVPQPDMFCYQCEQTEHHTGCTKVGMCGKTAETAAIQDLMVYVLKGMGTVCTKAREVGVPETELADANVFTIHAYFATLTNVNFDSARFVEYLRDAVAIRNKVIAAYTAACQKKGVAAENFTGAAAWEAGAKTIPELHSEGKEMGLSSLWKRQQEVGEEAAGLQELISLGMKGYCAYMTHAEVLGANDPDVYRSLHESLAFLATNPKDGTALVDHVLRCGKTAFRVLQLLDEHHVKHFGNPVPHPVRITTSKGKCILVSGHDLLDLEALLKQTEGKGIDIYTHGEMLPAHGYPGLHKYPHLKGNYGGPWQLQQTEFARFPGPIVLTTNCLIEPRKSYAQRLYTMNEVGWPNTQRIFNRDFSRVIDQALKLPGITKDEPAKQITVGFAHNAVLSVADKVLDAIKTGKLKRVFMIGGCDGSEGERNYYKSLGQLLPSETIILTLGCGKYRINKLPSLQGVVPGTQLPRLLDMGQCNDSYSAVVVASALAKALNTDINSLPLNLVVSWFEQKAVAVFLALLYLGVKNIRIGPALPAFLTPNTLQFLVQKFEVKPVDSANVEADLARMMAGK